MKPSNEPDCGEFCCCCLVTKSCPTLCNLMDCSPPGSSVHGISQARMLEWVAISFSRGPSQTRESNLCLLHWQVDSFLLSYQRSLIHTGLSSVQLLSRVRLFATPWTVARHAPLSMGFSRQECWSGLPFPSPGDLPNPGIEPRSPALQADTLTSEPPGNP